MKALGPVAAIALSLIALPCARADEAPSRQIAARTELHAIQTLTLSDQQFLTGDTSGKPTTITGELRIAQGSGRLPVVVLQHGSGGMGANIEMWARALNEIGISTFALDGFTGRGLTEVSTDQAKLGRLNFILDIYRALDVLAMHPRVDPQRVAIMGFSRGGQAALYSSVARFQKLWNKSGIEPVAYVPFYPDCMTTYTSDAEVVNHPIRIFGGTPDDYNPIAACKPFVERLRKAGHDVELTEYPNASHAFDSPLGAPTAVVSPNSQTVRNCRIQEAADGLLINVATKEPFAYKDACVERGPHLGHDPAATEAALASVKAFYRTTFKIF